MNTAWTELIARLTAEQQKRVIKLIGLSSPPDFFEYTRSLFPSPGCVTVQGRLLIRNLVLAWGVLLPELLTREQALEIADRAQRVEAFDLQLIQILSRSAENPAEDEKLMVGGLNLIDNLGPQPHLVMPLMKFLRHPSQLVRSKAAKRATVTLALQRAHFTSDSRRATAHASPAKFGIVAMAL